MEGVEVMLTVRLLGPPAIERDGQPLRSPRGRKAWALLCYVLLAERPPSRRYLSEMLFSDADDPLGALRWTLAELRRAVGGSLALRGDPVGATLEPDAIIDIHLLTREYADTSPLLDIAGELLEGMDLSSSPAFESWLLVERHRLSGMIEARLRQVAICEDILRRELGIDASVALRDAASTSVDSPLVPALGGRAAAASQLEAGRAAIVAGAVDAGLQCLRRAVGEADRCHDTTLHLS